ncbi:hypothetical protein [Shewanella fidelis]|uniref:Uncharacterized protein n=1 Tax=Shewanella fidelis TaxID=173509 RepID=A0AAW8NJZ4_9GAMM|nr:hypothetical protein [Shewanella fidelis]MDR8523177.1 hypothetical protein [Shewanella fidelis]MDW4811497.1 hypothetical protein [Shewanella fidelis]MDW4815618.1 hypothetical protein [Shewanella fidelis]MDW4819708.1 hypothetical protein [Shewanella fidelis]MDW4824318.1 hypothetical protein [Shewanella fidelis]
MEKVLFVTLANIESTSDVEIFNSKGYIFSNLKTMPFEHLENEQLPKEGEEFIVSIHHGSRHLYKCISSYVDKPFVVDGHDAVVYAKWIKREAGTKP